MIWFSSDLHLQHTNIHKYCPGRPGNGDLDAMREILIRNFNSVIKPSDSLYILGDIIFGRNKEMPERMNNFFSRVNGQKFLIRGNHDHYCKEEWFSKYFVWIKDYYELKHEKQRIILSHYPFLTWNGAHKGVWHLHGHSHGGLDQENKKTTRLDVGLDAEDCKYFPLSFDQIKVIMESRKYNPVDHHGRNNDL